MRTACVNRVNLMRSYKSRRNIMLLLLMTWSFVGADVDATLLNMYRKLSLKIPMEGPDLKQRMTETTLLTKINSASVKSVI